MENAEITPETTPEETMRTFPVKRKPYPKGPVYLVAPHPATDPFANHDSEIVATWIKNKYGMHTVMVIRATPTMVYPFWPWYGWYPANVKN